MTRRATSGWLVVVVAVLGLTGLGLTGCGDDTPSKDDFVDQMMTNGATPKGGDEGERWRKVWGCTYDEISSTDLLDRMMELQTDDAIPEDLSAEVSKVLGSCLQEVPSTAPTTVPGVPDPTGLTPTTVAPGAP